MKSIGARATILAILVGAWPAQAHSQCLRWDSSMGFSPSTGYSTFVLASFDYGSGPVLHTNADGGVWKWTGSSWALVGTDSFDDGVLSLCGYDDGTGTSLYAGGAFTHMSGSGLPIRGIAKLVGSAWQVVGNGLPVLSNYTSVWAMASFDDGGGRQLYVGGAFDSAPTFQSDGLLRWNGSTWSDVGTGLRGPAGVIVYTMCPFDDGSGPALYVGGIFATAGGVAASGIAKWNGSTWSALGSGLAGGQYPRAGSLAVFDDGSGPALYVGGVFYTAGGVPAGGLAKWDGTSWSAIPGVDTSTPGGVFALTVHDDGNGPALYASGVTIPAVPNGAGPRRWDGTTWSSLGAGLVQSSYVRSLLSFDDGQGGGLALIVGGQVSTVGGNLPSYNVARWLACTQPIEAICAGDGSFAVCPCSNYGSNLRGCANSTSTSGVLLEHSGTTNPDTLTLTSTAEPLSSLSMFLQTDSLRPAPLRLGDGILCLGGQLRRMYLKNAVNGTAQAPSPGDPSMTQRSAALGDPLAQGSVRYYQVWYRDGVASFCQPSAGSTFNISNGLRVVW